MTTFQKNWSGCLVDRHVLSSRWSRVRTQNHYHPLSPAGEPNPLVSPFVLQVNPNHYQPLSSY
ncbi:hypothetical protein Bpfe_014818, partial [Biomphalaria pfeifferi]